MLDLRYPADTHRNTHQPVIGERPVFASDNAWRRSSPFIALAVVLALVVLTGYVVYQASRPRPSAFTPTARSGWQAPDWPTVRENTAAAAIGTGELLRLVQLQPVAGQVTAVDPFTGAHVRTLSAAEVRSVKGERFAVDQYGVIPKKRIVLSFDDGPDPTWTPSILTVLSQAGVKATFCAIGDNIAAHPDVVEQVVHAGHLICNHSKTHPHLTDLDDAAAAHELGTTDRLIRAAGEVTSAYFRIPYEDSTDPRSDMRGLFVAGAQGYRTLGFSLSPLDWKTEPGYPLHLPLDGDGHMMVLHDGGGDRSRTLAYVASFIEEAKAAGYSFINVDQIPGSQPDVDYRTEPSGFYDRIELARQQASGWEHTTLTILLGVGVALIVITAGLYPLLAIISVRHAERRRRVWISTWRAGFNAPMVHVAIAAKNEEQVLRRTLDALLGSSRYPWDRLRVIVCDDGSEDGTFAVLQQCRGVYGDRLHILRNQHSLGKARSLNRILQGVGPHGIFVTIDADTIVEPTAIAELVLPFLSYGEHPHQQVGAVSGLVRVGNVNNLLTWFQSLEYLAGMAVNRMVESRLRSIMVAPGACTAWLASALTEIGGFSHTTLAEDADAVLKIQRLTDYNGHRRYFATQSLRAVSWTEAPQTLRTLYRQRRRWAFGGLQVWRRHAAGLCRPRYGILGLGILPFTMIGMLFRVVGVPLVWASVAVALHEGLLVPFLAIGGIYSLVELIPLVVALHLARATWRHLPFALAFRLFVEPLTMIVLYPVLLSIARGRVRGWDKFQRWGTVTPVSGSLALPTGTGAEPAALPTEPITAPILLLPAKRFETLV
jgi:cellulose synthase/poly-beta-1,6-N-acetylglucosamine synthase-like glycosyltransferase/peptidoglycan/xylan/chitin deacetylase (PgdA/CDA1 family)